jgi:hypothetical protein
MINLDSIIEIGDIESVKINAIRRENLPILENNNIVLICLIFRRILQEVEIVLKRMSQRISIIANEIMSGEKISPRMIVNRIIEEIAQIVPRINLIESTSPDINLTES